MGKCLRCEGLGTVIICDNDLEIKIYLCDQCCRVIDDLEDGHEVLQYIRTLPVIERLIGATTYESEKRAESW